MGQGLHSGELSEAELGEHRAATQVVWEQLSVAAVSQRGWQVVERIMEGRSLVGLGCH